MMCHNYAVADWWSMGHVIVTIHGVKKETCYSDSYGKLVSAKKTASCDDLSKPPSSEYDGECQA